MRLQHLLASAMHILETVANPHMAHQLGPRYTAAIIVANALVASRLDHIQATTQSLRRHWHRNQSSTQSDLKCLPGQTATSQVAQYPRILGK